MALDEPINCTLCQCLAGDRCTFHDVELENPAFTLCPHFRLPGEDPESMALRFPLLDELNSDWIYELDPNGEAAPLFQVGRRRRSRSTGVLPRALPALPEVESAPTPDLRDRFAGALAGLAVGDALGFAAEGLSPQQIEDTYGGPLKGYVARVGRRHTWPLHQVSRLTQTAQLLGESLLAERQLDMDDFAERLVRWLPGGVKPGGSTIQAVSSLAEGRHWAVSGIDSNGSGSTLRVVPLALLRHRDYALLRQEAVLQGMPTHVGEKAYAASVLFATAIASLANTPRGALSRADLLSLLERAIRGIDAEMTARLHEVAALLAEGAAPAAAMARFRTGGYVLECVPSALFTFLAYPEDPARALLLAANAGFDATSVAGMVGALAGAYLGRSGLPGQFVADLPAAAELAALGERLHALAAEREGQTA